MAPDQRLASLILPAGRNALARPRPVDWVIGSILAAAAIAELAFDTNFLAPLPNAVVSAIAVAAFVWRRVQPLLAIVALSAATVASDVGAALSETAFEFTFANVIAALCILYAMGRWAPPNVVATTAVLSSIIVPATSMLNPIDDPSLDWLAIGALGNAVVLVAGLLVRASMSAREQRELAQRLRQRTVLANDIHDSVAHHMSAIAIRAEAARQLDDRDALDDALKSIKRSASAGLADMRHLVSSLRDPDDQPRALPGLGDIHNLALDLSDNEIHLEIVVEGNVESMSVAVSDAAYAIAREALTNVRRHAVGVTHACVRASSTTKHVDITVTDNGVASAAEVAKHGFGLRSMTERARSLGGDLTAGPNPTGGWLVAARLPHANDSS